MNFLSASDKLLCFTGNENVHVTPLKSDASDVSSILIHSNANAVSSQKPALKAKVTNVCASISADSKYLAVADSNKLLYVYENISENSWNLLASLKTEKRLLRVLFSHCSNNYLVLSDKCGDVWVISLSSLKKNILPTKILGHCSVVLDECLNSNSTRIFTCDRDEKIRVSSFPDSYIIEGYFLGHKEAVVSICLLKNDSHLLSVDIEGSLKLWKTDSKLCILTVKLFSLFQLDCSDVKPKVDYQINTMKCTEAFDKIYLTVRILNCSKVYILELNVETLTVRLVGDVEAASKVYDMRWIKNILYIADPNQSERLVQVEVTNDGKFTGPTSFTIARVEEILSDVKAFVANNQDSNIPLRKRVAYDFSDRESLSKVQRMDINVKNEEINLHHTVETKEKITV